MDSHEPPASNRTVNFESSTSPFFSSTIPQMPFAFPFLRPSTRTHAATVDIPLILNELKQSAAEMIRSFADSNPLLKNLALVSSQFNHFCQVQIQNKHNCNNSFRAGNFAAILPGDSVAGMVVTNGIVNFLNIYNTILVCRLVLTWFPNAPPAIVSPLSTLCDPYLNIFRGLIPPLGGTLDLSPILAFLVLNAFTSTASALPAELPPSMRSQSTSSVHETHASYTTSQEKWIRRFKGIDSQNQGGIN